RPNSKTMADISADGSGIAPAQPPPMPAKPAASTAARRLVKRSKALNPTAAIKSASIRGRETATAAAEDTALHIIGGSRSSTVGSARHLPPLANIPSDRARE